MKLMNKVKLGIVLGTIAGVVDVMPMLAQKLTWDANLSAFSLWVISGYLIANTKIVKLGVLRGIIVSFLVLTPSAFLIGWQQPIALIPIFGMTLVLGSLLGFLIDKFGSNS